MSSIDHQAALKWREASQTLEGWTELDGRKIYVQISREMVHSLPMYNDAIGWEIERFKGDIVQRLSSSLLHDALE
jgi:hypothetical protein